MDNYTATQRDSIQRACDEDLRAVLQVFHEALVEADKTDVFASPVTDDVAPQYSEIITHPMDFGTMQDKLVKYKSFREYFAHVELVFSNAITYNTWDGFIGGLVQDLQKYSVKFLLDAANVNLRGSSTTKKSRTRAVGRSPTKAKAPTAASSGKQRARKKPVAAVSEDEEDSWHSSTSESEEDDDDGDEDEEDFSDESDWGGAGRKRRLRRPAQASKNKKKKSKRRY
ncbi:Bromodomain and WD repeat-containing protein 1 [Phytophthora cinnamomi]|uniref:Bromodomain and WD repeat-containing protein 1 n=1 Tax=Phytophthora cinnamomi TaxID=4785 RepID=UPI0035595D1B|nr:Bromodomain and WD repeat-containing protein 1 [Phytophthora cinnamomi]